MKRIASILAQRRFSGRLLTMAALVLGSAAWGLSARLHAGPAPVPVEAAHAGRAGVDLVRVSAAQLRALDAGPVAGHAFANTRQAIGIIDFDQDRTVAVSPAYAGRITRVLVKAGDAVQAGQTLYTVAVPDVAQAAAGLVSSAGNLRSADDTLNRARALARDDSIPQKELQQDEADQQAAEAAYHAARRTLSLFGLAEADIAHIERQHNIDIEMPVKSPIAGRVTARSAQAGLLIQPGASPAPVTVSDQRQLWMVASVPESDFSLYRIGQPVRVRVQAWPDRVFDARVSWLGEQVDPDTHRIAVRAEVADPDHVLRPQMLADFQVELSAPRQDAAVPAAAVVHEASGADVVWRAAGQDAQGSLWRRQPVAVGRSDQGQVQITQGLQPGDRVARRDALFLSNLYESNAD